MCSEHGACNCFHRLRFSWKLQLRGAAGDAGKDLGLVLAMLGSPGFACPCTRWYQAEVWFVICCDADLEKTLEKLRSETKLRGNSNLDSEGP